MERTLDQSPSNCLPVWDLSRQTPHADLGHVLDCVTRLASIAAAVLTLVAGLGIVVPDVPNEISLAEVQRAQVMSR